jgi:hypothetical protein
MKAIVMLLALGALTAGCGFGQGKRDAVAHFRTNYPAILAFAEFFRTNNGIDYVEFCPGDRIDLLVLDRERFDRRSPPAVFKYQLFGVAVNSPGVSNALAYGSFPPETLVALRALALEARCISVARPFWESSPVEIEVGYARDGMTKSVYRKFRDSTSVSNLVSQSPCRDDCLAPLTGGWILVVGRSAFN